MTFLVSKEAKKVKVSLKDKDGNDVKDRDNNPVKFEKTLSNQTELTWEPTVTLLEGYINSVSLCKSDTECGVAVKEEVKAVSITNRPLRHGGFVVEARSQKGNPNTSAPVVFASNQSQRLPSQEDKTNGSTTNI